MNTPKIRFKGFEDDWEQRKLGDIAGNVYGGGTPKTNVDEYWNGDIPWIQSSNVQEDQLFNVEISKKITNTGLEKSAAKLIPANSIAVVTHVGVGKLVYMPFSYATSQDFISLSDLKTDEKFMCYSLYQRLQKDIYIVQGSAIKGITKEDLLTKQIMIPCKAEQEKIGNYFQSLDHLITLHQRKCDETKQLKKFMLQKMFPKNGEKNPEIRFEGFTDDWEQRKLGEIVLRESLARESTIDLPYVEYEDVIAEEGRINKDIRKKEGIKKGIFFDGSQVLYGKLRPYLHNWLNPDFSGVAVGDWWVLKPNNVDKNFIYRLIQTQQFDDIANQSTGSKMPRADWNLVSNTEFAIPTSQVEQTKIGGYFFTLDNLITLHQRKCEKLKELKKYMLQNMFV